VAGLKGYYAPEALLGRTIIVCTNMEPRKMRGVESRGMLLAATFEQDEGRGVVLLTTDADVPPGAPVS